MKTKLTIITLLIVTSFLTGCKNIELQSSIKDREITIDGNAAEWTEKKIYINKKNISIGLMNDDSYLYLCFYPTTRKLSEQLLKKGFTLWFNNEAKNKKNLGLRFPFGTRNNAENKNDKTSFKNRNAEFTEKIINKIPQKLEIVNSKNKVVKSIKFENLVGVEIALGAEKGVIVYELKIPLKQNEVYSAYIGAEPNSEITICFESAEIDPEEMRTEKKGRSGGMGGRKGGGGGHAGKSGSMGGADRQNSSPMSFWAKITLTE